MRPPTKFRSSSRARSKSIRYSQEGSELGAWEQLGFTNPWKYASTDDDLSLTVAVANYIPILTGASSSGAQSASAMNERLKKDFYAVNGYSVQTLNTVAMRTLQAPHHSTHEKLPRHLPMLRRTGGRRIRVDPARPDERRDSVERP